MRLKKEFIKALSNPEVIEIVEIDENLRKKLDENLINKLIEKNQVYLIAMDKNLVCQGSNENVQTALSDLQCTSLGKKEESGGADFNKVRSISGSSKHSNKETSAKSRAESVSEFDDLNEINWLIDMKNLAPESFSRISSKLNNEKKKSPVRESTLHADSNPFNLNKKSTDFKKKDNLEETIQDCDKRFIIIDGNLFLKII